LNDSNTYPLFKTLYYLWVQEYTCTSTDEAYVLVGVAIFNNIIKHG